MSALDGRVALVTGSTRGIGAAIARRFAAEGALVVVHGRDRDAAAAVERQIDAAGGRAISVLADLTDAGRVDALRATVEDQLGPVDVVVANAGESPVPPVPVEDVAEDDWRAVMDANLTATFLPLKAFLPGMKERRRGAVVTSDRSGWITGAVLDVAGGSVLA